MPIRRANHRLSNLHSGMGFWEALIDGNMEMVDPSWVFRTGNALTTFLGSLVLIYIE